MTGKIILGAVIVFLVLMALMVIALVISPRSIEEQEADDAAQMDFCRRYHERQSDQEA